MPLPSPNALKALIQSDRNLDGAKLATRIILGRLRIEVRNNPALIDAKVAELIEFTRANAFAADDLANI
ncbi:hypothetical protein SAMN05443432_104305 [Roseovarius litoreus]|jgi:hypothetical protein|uniref:Uncharacterized protein n=1 Tax=Roseovarius litoreus TaxID=1155722 RepID=A0A1M7FSY9_9RHOB|nr:hypothetical protein [Roseovarius litoreus]SHM06789.1 hypothetical protein SAMN05443432_104305 [Roseovarius litoreus]